ncbi:MAG: type II CAAX prenyl endopeptidase Rce1 family protein [Opitutales bacterium]
MDPTLAATLYCLLAGGVLLGWLRERAARTTTGAGEGFWPGTTSAPAAAHFAAAAATLLITVAESVVEIRADVSQSQSVLTGLSLLALLAAAIIEEVVFRGFAAPAWLAGGRLLTVIVAGSTVFALVHGFDLGTVHGRVSLAFAFVTSLGLYVARFNPLNPGRSLTPCFTAHIVRNLAVFGIKWAQGFVTW